ncbi:adenine nucleotide alpha hydrolase [Vibrio kyushuensis]|uniref:Dph6-related ATP pyrophosphatase n=1 Tax=Vibrio kyushuensis TaxID=2910249 RepID=UPI003D11546D
MKKNVVISWSSGKDSTLTLIRLLEDPNFNVVGLYTTYVKDEVPFQATPLEVVQMQADLVRLPLITIELPEVFPSNAIYQETVIDGLKSSTLPIDAIAFGDMFCNGIVDYRKSYIEPAGWDCVFPLLGEPSETLAAEILRRGIITSLITIDGDRLDREYCGREYSHYLLKELPENIDPCGENGEFHTLVTQAPCFEGKIELKLLYVDHDERFSYQRYQATALPNHKEKV